MTNADETTPPSGALPLMKLERYRLRFRERTPRGQPSRQLLRAGYLGSAWRGAFGHALKQTVCVTGLADCGACALLDSCPYPSIFESRTPPDAKKLKRYPHTPNPYILEPADHGYDLDGETVNLGVTLFGRANGQIPHIIEALKLAGRGGLTARRVQLDLLEVQAERPERGNDWQAAHDLSNGLGATPCILAPPVPSAIKILLISPLRIRRNERLVGASAFDFRAFAGNLLRRLSLLTNFFGDAPWEADFAGLLRQAESIPVANSDLSWREGSRHSSRQGGKIPLGGLTGAFELESSKLALFWPYIWLGQWTHIGKGCTMGLGRYVVKPVGADDDQSSKPLQWPTPNRL